VNIQRTRWFHFLEYHSYLYHSYLDQLMWLSVTMPAVE
jgi:hypothetical protein